MNDVKNEEQIEQTDSLLSRYIPGGFGVMSWVMVFVMVFDLVFSQTPSWNDYGAPVSMAFFLAQQFGFITSMFMYISWELLNVIMIFVSKWASNIFYKKHEKTIIGIRIRKAEKRAEDVKNYITVLQERKLKMVIEEKQ